MTEELDSIRVVSEVELRRMLGISDKTFERMRLRGDVPPKTQLSARRIGYRVVDVKEWLDQRRRSPAAGGADQQAGVPIPKAEHRAA
jgi:predicted DNA-binding transcriptional regulator AlpA